MTNTNATLLLLDDDPMILRATRRLLTGFEIATVDDPRSALAIVAAGARFDAIVCDFEMPYLDGRATFEAVQSMAPAQARAFVFLSGEDSPRAKEFFESVPNRRLEKPATAAALREAIEETIAKLR